MMPCEGHRQDSWAWRSGWIGYVWYIMDYYSKQKIQAGMFVLDAEEEGEKLHIATGVQEALSQLHSQPFKPLLLV